MIAQSSAAVAALQGLDWRIDTALIDFECPLISPVEVPVSMLNAYPSLQYNIKHHSLKCEVEQTDLSRPWPTAIILLLSPSHARSFLPHQINTRTFQWSKLTSSRRWSYTLPSTFDLHQWYPKFSLNYSCQPFYKLQSPNKPKAILTSPINICRSTVIPRRREPGHCGIMYMAEVRHWPGRRLLSSQPSKHKLWKQDYIISRSLATKGHNDGSRCKEVVRSREWFKNKGVKQAAPTLKSLIYTTSTHNVSAPIMDNQDQDQEQAHNYCLSIGINHFIPVWTDLGRRPTRRDGIRREYTTCFERH